MLGTQNNPMVTSGGSVRCIFCSSLESVVFLCDSFVGSVIFIRFTYFNYVQRDF